MLFRLNILLAVVLIIFSFSSFAVEAETTAPDETGVKTTETKAASFPYVADIIGADVYIRSGPGTAYYFCRKANAPDKVTVVEHMHTWAKIIPPQGSFSWISKNYVKADPTNPKAGIVTGDGVRVWAGSDYEVPMRSSSLQTKLNQGDFVTLMDETGQGEYYKIAPPVGAYLWVSTQYLKYSGPVAPPKPVILPPKPEVKPEPTETEKPKQETVVEKSKPEPKTTEPKPAVEPEVKPEVKPEKKESPVEMQMIENCKKIGEEIDAELAKPLEEQNFASMKKALNKVSEDKDAGRAKLYADYQLERIGRFELAQAADKELNRQDTELNKALEKINKKRDAAIADKPAPGKHIVIGTLKVSQVYTAQTGQKRYTIVNEAGKIECYAIAVGGEADSAAQKLTGHKVGLVGRIAATSKGPVSLIEFTKIDDLNDNK